LAHVTITRREQKNAISPCTSHGRVEFHNTTATVYGAPMISAAPRTLLARLRASSRLAVLVLLVFGMKIGAAAACATHDFADLGVGTESAPAAAQILQLEAPDTDLTTPAAGHAGTCNHCGCHHSAADIPASQFSLAVPGTTLTVRVADLPPGAPPPLELRPPIA
jgi:hypothetical protein